MGKITRRLLLRLMSSVGISAPRGNAAGCGFTDSRAEQNARTAGGPFREERVRNWIVRIDLGGQVLHIDIPEDKGYGRDAERLEPPLFPTLRDISPGGFASASMLAQKAKQFDDGLYAAAEIAAQRGAGSLRGKQFLLQRTMEGMSGLRGNTGGNLPYLLFAARTLGGLAGSIPVEFQRDVQRVLDEFRSDELRSKPVGFYTWSDELKAIFGQDRLLQSELKGKPGIEALVRFFKSDAAARSAYEAHLALASKLTNPFPAELRDLRGEIAALDSGSRPVSSGGVYFFPPSRAHETDLIKRLYGNRPIPDGFNLAEEMIRRIRSGDVRLRPGAESGWYDYQTWALEPLVTPGKMPEGRHLDCSNSYRNQLLELFKGILALTRETHIKQLEIPMAGAAMPPEIVITPKLSAEPVATYYQRRAESYAFVRGVLEKTFGAGALSGMHRLSAGGPMAPTLADELRQMEGLFRGAYQTVSRELGMDANATTDAKTFQDWAAGAGTDPDLGQDSRMMVPIFYDLARRKIKVWAFLGWTSRPLKVSFYRKPSVEVLDASTRQLVTKSPEIMFESSSFTLAYPVTAEVYVDRVLDRDEFRRRCDTHKTRSEILRNL